MSDIHSNLEALEAVSNDFKNFPIYCSGDIIGYGANPKEVVQWFIKRNVNSVLGNHDYAITQNDTKWFNDKAGVSIKWTYNNLNSNEIKYLKSLQISKIVKINELKMLIVHGSPEDKLFEYVHQDTHEHLFEEYLKQNKVDIILMGHTHIPFIWECKNGMIINPGSVGQPRSGNNKATYVLLELNNKKIKKASIKKVSYDIETAAKKIKAAGLPVIFAERLFTGI